MTNNPAPHLWSQWLDLSRFEPVETEQRRRTRAAIAITGFVISLLLTQVIREPNIGWFLTLIGGALLIFSLWGPWLKSNQSDADLAFRDRSLRSVTLVFAVLALSYALEPLYHGTVDSTLPDLIASAAAVGLAALALNARQVNLANATILIFPIEYVLYLQLHNGYWDTYIVAIFLTLIITIQLVSNIGIGLIGSAVIFALHVIITITNPTNLVNPLAPTDYYKAVPLDLTTTAVLIAIVALTSSFITRELAQRRKNLADLVETLEARVAARTRDLEVAADVSRQVVSDLNLDSLLVTLVERTRSAFNLSAVSIFNYAPTAQTLTYAAGASQPGIAATPLIAQPDDLVTQAAHTQKPALDNGLPATNALVRSELALPVLVTGELLGVLDLQANTANRFGSVDIKTLETLTNQIAIAIRNARSFTAETAFRAESDLLLRLSEAANGANSYPALIESAVKVAGALPYTVTLSFFERLDASQATYLETVTVLPAGQREAAAVSIHDPVFAPPSSRARLLIIEDLDRPPPEQTAIAALYKQRGVKSLLLMYLKLGEQIVGTLTFTTTTAYQFLPGEIRLVQGVSDILVSAVERIRLYNEQVQAAEQLRTLDKMKSQFLASMSHELRTPLNAILNFTEFVILGLLGPVNDRQRDALNKSLESGKHLLSLINDVLDITKIEAKMMTLYVEDNLDLHVELAAAVAATQTLLADKPVVLIQDIDADLPLMIGDKRRIRQILLNLLSNAVKFTEQGSVTLSAKNRGDDVLFAVIDTGPGIAEADQMLIFEPFIQTEVGLKHAGGTGLGLPISKRLVEAHCGQLWVESEAGDGAAFYISLPVRPPQLVQMLTIMGAVN